MLTFYLKPKLQYRLQTWRMAQQALRVDGGLTATTKIAALGFNTVNRST